MEGFLQTLFFFEASLSPLSSRRFALLRFSIDSRNYVFGCRLLEDARDSKIRGAGTDVDRWISMGIPEKIILLLTCCLMKFEVSLGTSFGSMDLLISVGPS